jgi:hypothetical protein
MPMPPPKASTEGPRDRQVAHEMSQVVRALRTEGPMTRAALADRLGAVYWDDDASIGRLGMWWPTVWWSAPPTGR